MTLALAMRHTSPGGDDDDEDEDVTLTDGSVTARPPPDLPHNNASTANMHFENDTRVSGEVVFDIDETVAHALKMRRDDDDDEDEDEEEEDEEDYQKAYFVFGEGFDPIELTNVLRVGSDEDNEDNEGANATNDGAPTNAGGGGSTN